MTSNVSVGQPSHEELITSTLRVLTWNVWGRFGPWQAREAALINTLKLVQPDIVALQECWRAPDGETQASRLGQALGYHHTYGSGTFLVEDWGTGSGLLSRWPIQSHEYREFPAIAADRWGGSALFGCVDGPRGLLPVFSVGLDWPPYASAARRASVGHLVAFVGERASVSFPPIICGDFNTGPDSDEIRSLTGRRDTVAPGFVLFDAWEMAGNGSGHTWTQTNPWTARALLPDKRIDYIFVGWPCRGGAGHVLRCSIEGVEPFEEVVPSDHYAVCAELRY